MKSKARQHKYGQRWLRTISHTVRGCTAAFAVLALTSSCALASIVFSENMGTTAPTSSPYPSVSSYAGYQNNGSLSFAGSGEARGTEASDYSGASGGANIYLVGNGANSSFTISSISTVGFTSLKISFGAFKSTIASSMSELVLKFSSDGVSYSSLTIPAQATGSGTSTWRLIDEIALPVAAEGVSNLRLQWVNADPSGTPNPYFRLDDIKLEGVAVPEPSTFVAGALLALPFGVQGVRYLRNRKRA